MLLHAEALPDSESIEGQGAGGSTFAPAIPLSMRLFQFKIITEAPMEVLQLEELCGLKNGFHGVVGFDGDRERNLEVVRKMLANLVEQ